MPRKAKMTDEERRAYSAKMRGELEAVMDRAYGAMVASEEFWAAVMRTAANLTHADRDDRSPTNCMAIAAQHPNATHVLSSGDWRKVGRFPVKGSTSLRIWTPVKRRPEGVRRSRPQPPTADSERPPARQPRVRRERCPGSRPGRFSTSARPTATPMSRPPSPRSPLRSSAMSW